MTQPTDQIWPHNFQPSPGREQPAQAPLRIPASVLDLFYLRPSTANAAELAAVIGCLKGDLELVVGDQIGALPEELQAQIRAADVSRRGVFRAITARELYVAALDAVDQDMRVAGLNDALHLYVRMQAQAAPGGGAMRTVGLSQAGQLTIGRLDLLRAFLDGAEHVFQSSADAGAHVYHLMLPAAPLAEIERGSGIVLVYPILDPLVLNSVDNSFVVMRIAYDLLVRLQQDMLGEQHGHAFGSAQLPVPSRRRLEAELQADGYAIVGDTAEQQAQPRADGQASSLLQRLRSLAQQWSAPRIALPPQARPEDYLRLIGGVLPAISTPEDLAVAEALARLVEARASPAHGRSAPPLVGPRQPVQPSVPSSPPARQSAARPTTKHSWSQDFAAPPAPQPASGAAWWEQQGATAYTGETQKLTPADATAHAAQLLSSKDDWMQDFLAEQGAQAQRAPGPQRAAAQPARSWSSDFAGGAQPKQPEQPDDDWVGDFGPQKP